MRVCIIIHTIIHTHTSRSRIFKSSFRTSVEEQYEAAKSPELGLQHWSSTQFSVTWRHRLTCTKHDDDEHNSVNSVSPSPTFPLSAVPELSSATSVAKPRFLVVTSIPSISPILNTSSHTSSSTQFRTFLNTLVCIYMCMYMWKDEGRVH